MSAVEAVMDPTTIQLEESVSLENKLKPYRSTTYDKYDILYASHMKRMYTYVDDTIKLEFNKFTENLLDEKEITRNQLLNAIDNFPYKYQYKINKDENKDKNKVIDFSAWIRFTDEAFNYRPYQPCVIS